MKAIIKIEIGKEDTTIWHSKKFFKNRVDAIETAISHLETILREYKIKLKEYRTNKRLANFR